MIDFHCHLDLYSDPKSVVGECAERGLYILAVTTTPSAWEKSSALTAGRRRMRSALGLHPQLARERRSELELFDTFLPQTRYVGEIGLDGGPECKSHWSDQLYVFDHVLSSCRSAGGRIMTIHSRRAAGPVLDRLKLFQGSGVPILHWYSGSLSNLRRAIDLGCWFSVGPAMLASERGRALAAEMPLDRVLTETDGPFARIDDREARPWDVEIASTALASLKGLDRQEVDAITHENLRRLATLV